MEWHKKWQAFGTEKWKTYKYIATSHRPGFACIHYIAVVQWNLNKYRLPELRTRHDFNRSIFPWQISQEEFKSKYDVKYLFEEELAARLSSRFKKYEIAIAVPDSRNSDAWRSVQRLVHHRGFCPAVIPP